MKNKWSVSLFQDEAEDEDQDSLKEALLETSPYLLGATVMVSILHSVFELLAFKNGINLKHYYIQIIQNMILNEELILHFYDKTK